MKSEIHKQIGNTIIFMKPFIFSFCFFSLVIDQRGCNCISTYLCLDLKKIPSLLVFLLILLPIGTLLNNVMAIFSYRKISELWCCCCVLNWEKTITCYTGHLELLSLRHAISQFELPKICRQTDDFKKEGLFCFNRNNVAAFSHS